MKECTKLVGHVHHERMKVVTLTPCKSSAQLKQLLGMQPHEWQSQLNGLLNQR
jgi:hypothetical protein